MKQLIITADIHGSLSTWLTITALLKPDDALVIAGDLFDTRYGSWSDPDFKPDDLKKQLAILDQPVYYVYGNCDVPSFCPGYTEDLVIDLFNKKIFLHHGHKRLLPDISADIVIQGHTHLCALEEKNNVIHLNPGSITRPKNGLATYAVIDQESVSLIELKSGAAIAQIHL